ncbi:hypothetical protein [Aliivibrio fischeri]|uniref:hypothetical protein n=1 Tax=Aliivibrio fischeri TaxID=668 RepID=UPI0012D85B96|nr:hypothetical protein [Aliivibrio fischeri]MUJ20435.1 hypothetical protein [Aliivibrio fischeri]
MLTIGTLIDHLKQESKQLNSTHSESVLSFLHNDFELEILLVLEDEYVAQIKDSPARPVSVASNLKYLHCFNRDLPIVIEGVRSEREVSIIAYNSPCGKVEFCLTPDR